MGHGLDFLKPEKFAMNCIKWWFWRALVGVMIFWFLLLFFVPFATVIWKGFSFEAWKELWDYVIQTLEGDLLQPFRGYNKWLGIYFFSEPRHTTWQSFFTWRILLLPTFIFLYYEFMICYVNPFFLASFMSS